MNAAMNDRIYEMQKNEVTEYYIYRALARRIGGENGKVLERIAEDEMRHAMTWQKRTGRNAVPCRLRIWFYIAIATVLGVTFAINLMERGEEAAESTYRELGEFIPEAMDIYRDETEHERELMAMIDEERLNYISSMVLGLNDALVELTGTLAGLTFALANSKVVGLAGLITGIAATLSMGASEYLSKKAYVTEKHPLKAAVYTGLAYVVTVFLLLLPFFVISSPYVALVFSLLNASLVIFFFNFYVSVVRDKPFWPSFMEMLAISFGVAGISFLIGLLARVVLKVEI